MGKLRKCLWHDESGQDLTEYALLLALISLSAIVGMNSMAQAVSNVFANAATNLSSAT
jgi:Flp pilus assembly pilin Flp